MTIADVKRVLEELDYQYDPDCGWTRVVHEHADSRELAGEVLRHMGGDPEQHPREVGMIRHCLRCIAEKVGEPEVFRPST